MPKPLVSIIIPTYNRAHLIGETLDSVLAQTYENWECIVVDDGSTDNTDEVMAAYCAKDSRFRYYHRPNTHKPGGSGARNYGLIMSKGEYVNWFDSDDLMMKEFLEIKIDIFLKYEVDFVISRSENFNGDENRVITKYNDNCRVQLTGSNYIKRKIYWMTPDFLIKHSLLKSIHFDESLRSGQETNFFIRLLCLNPNLKGKAIDHVLCLRRIHQHSIQQKLQKDLVKAQCGKLLSLLAAYKEIGRKLDGKTRRVFQQEIMSVFYKDQISELQKKEYCYFIRSLFQFGNFFKALAFLVAIYLSTRFNKGYKIYLFARS